MAIESLVWLALATLFLAILDWYALRPTVTVFGRKDGSALQ